MIDKSSALKAVLERLKKMPLTHCLDLRSYKRDRSVLIVKDGESMFRVIENGFHKEVFEVDLAGLRTLLKKLLKREFPRSNKLRIYMLGIYKQGKTESYSPGKI